MQHSSTMEASSAILTAESDAMSSTKPVVGATVVVDMQGFVGSDYARRTAKSERPFVVVGEQTESPNEASTTLELSEFLSAGVSWIRSIDRLVLVLPSRPSAICDRVVARCCTLTVEYPECRICLVSSYRVHFADGAAQSVEAAARRRFERVAPGRYVVLRVGNVLPSAASSTFRSRLTAAAYPLVSTRFRSCYLDPSELFETLEDLTRRKPVKSGRVFTVLGENRTTRAVWAESRSTSTFAAVVTAVAFLLQLLLVDRILGLLFALVAMRRPVLRCRQFDTLDPRDASELLCLYHPYNLQHVALAGYNTGVTHFGWRFPRKTILKTTGSGRRIRVRDAAVIVDAGVTLKRVVDALTPADRQFYVVPNYSYISMGTAFFVPIHGSGSEVSTLGETIESVLVYDASIDRIVALKRGEASFARAMYAPQNGILVLRLRFRIRPRTHYFVRTTTLEGPTANDIWQLFADPTASNIEVRKSRADATSVQVSKYYTSSTADQEALEVPRDSIGRVWDRLEENPLAAPLFHGFVRRFGFHVELFLNEAEFATFWAAHVRLPLAKLQLRFVRCDGMPHSPCGDRDRISIDLFMRRSKRLPFLRFMKDELPHARFNPGKHSM